MVLKPASMPNAPGVVMQPNLSAPPMGANTFNNQTSAFNQTVKADITISASDPEKAGRQVEQGMNRTMALALRNARSPVA